MPAARLMFHDARRALHADELTLQPRHARLSNTAAAAAASCARYYCATDADDADIHYADAGNRRDNRQSSPSAHQIVF